MARVLVLYGTTEGQTAKISEHIAAHGRRQGHDVKVVHVANVAPDLDVHAFDVFVVGASLHEGHHQRYVLDWVQKHRDVLTKKPSAFFQVSLTSVVRDPEHDRQARGAVDALVRETGWTPSRIAYFAGALKYTQYNWMKRAMMRMIAKRDGGDTDTSRDVEYTDWAEVERWAGEIWSALPRRQTAPRAAP